MGKTIRVKDDGSRQSLIAALFEELIAGKVLLAPLDPNEMAELVVPGDQDVYGEVTSLVYYELAKEIAAEDPDIPCPFREVSYQEPGGEVTKAIISKDNFAALRFTLKKES